MEKRMNHEDTATRRVNSPRRGGFTLLELLIVITMMIFISAIALMNYFGAMRAASFTTVSKDVFNALLMARQRACLDNKPVYFYVLDSSTFVLQESLGSVTHIASTDTYPGAPAASMEFFLQSADTTSFSSNSMPILNIDRFGSGAGVWLVESGNLTVTNVDANGNPVTYAISACVLHVTNIPPTCTWCDGDRYGAVLFAPQMLPKGFTFTSPATTPMPCVTFNPDGTVVTDGDTPPLVITETISGKKVTFSITPTGKVTQGQ